MIREKCPICWEIDCGHSEILKQEFNKIVTTMKNDFYKKRKKEKKSLRKFDYNKWIYNKFFINEYIKQGKK